jgi:trans-2,3-dihydro-3-hydroxyanthranilate isomerase
MDTRRRFLTKLAVSTIAPVTLGRTMAFSATTPNPMARSFHFVQIDVFTSQPLEGNPLSVFTDARGLNDSEMQDLARETNLQETGFVLPREVAVESQEGVKVRIFTPEKELPFAGHPTLGTAAVLRTLKMRDGGVKAGDISASTMLLDLKVGKVPVSFREDENGIFGEMRQVPPVFGLMHDRDQVAEALGLKVLELEPDLPVQTVSTGLPFAIVPIKSLSTLQSLQLNLGEAYAYLKQRQTGASAFYFITRDTGDPRIGLRARAIYPNGEDPATGSAAGCTSAWMVKYGVVPPEQTVLILQGVEIKRPSKLFVRSSRSGNSILNCRGWGICCADNGRRGDFLTSEFRDLECPGEKLGTGEPVVSRSP